LLFILILTGLALWIDFAPEDTFLGRDVSIRQGLDLQGGIQVLLRAEESAQEITREEMQTAAGVIERRETARGVGETVVQLSGDDRIIVELPGVEDPEQAIETLRGTGRLEFIDPQGQFLPEGQLVLTSNAPDIPRAVLASTLGITDTENITDTTALLPPNVTETIYPSITDGADLDTSQVQPVLSQGGVSSEPAVSFAFLGDSASSLANFTANNVGQPMCIVLDHQVVSCPVIQSPLTDGSGIITTNSMEDRERIFNQLKFGALPVALQVETSRTVSATLGEQSVSASIIAGIVGLSTVAVFMIFYYRLPGVIAVLALLIYTALNFALYSLIPVTLTLPGIAGFILSIGLAVDANVLIFARLKEELRRKRSLGSAIEAGFNEAWSAIRDSSVSTLITSAILWLFGNSFGVSLIKGFAITLGLGVLLSLFTAVVVTRTLLRLIVPLGFANNLWFFEINRSELARSDAPASPETV
jgi:preprotein translocase subunit SecD